MRQETPFSSSAGKTIEAIDYSLSGQGLVTFTDGTFSVIGIKRGWEAGDEELGDDILSVLSYGDDVLIEMGIITAIELSERRDLDVSARRSAANENDRALYERLKLRFDTNFKL